MNEHIPAPIKGEPTRASWGRAVTEVCNSVRAAGFSGALVRDGAGAFGNAPLPANNRNRIASVQPHVFEVRWNSGANNNAGAWTVFLPNDHLLMVDGDYVDIGGVSPIQDSDGWCVIDDGNKEASHVWVSIDVTDNYDGQQDVAAVITCEDPGSDDEGGVRVCLAEIIHPEAESGAAPTVKQSVVGALALSLSSDADAVEPDDVSVEFTPPSDGDETDASGDEDTPAGEDAGMLQIKGWKSGEPTSEKSLIDHLTGDEDDGITIVSRDHSGKLEYMRIGKIPNRKIVAGPGIKVSETKDGEIVIEAIDPDPSSGLFTGEIVALKAIGYNESGTYVYQKPIRLNVRNGLIMTKDDTNAEENVHTAVEES